VVGARGEQGDVVLFVSDTGVGIPAGDQERIFVAGERLDPTRPGAGIGLALVGAIAEAHGAQLAVSSSPGEGATFTIALPAHHPATRASSS
jgi:signal transduction histidine kinase